MKKIISTSALIILVTIMPYCQSSPGQVISAFFQKINAGQIDDAISDLNSSLSDNPEHFGILNTLGYAYRSKKDYTKSVEYYEKAYNAQVMFNLGVAHALSGDKDKAFEMLSMAKETDSLNITNVGLSPAAAILQDDGRYSNLSST